MQSRGSGGTPKSSGLWNRLRGGTGGGVGPVGGKTTAPAAAQVRKRQNKPSKAEVRQLEPSPWLGTLVLGLWDNTCGPRIDQVWQGGPEAAHDEEMLAYAVRLTLASEIGAAEQAGSGGALTQKFHLFAELSTMIVSTSFGVAHSEGAFKYALVVLCDAAHLPRYLELADVVQDRMFRLASAIQQLLERRLPAAGHAAHLRRFVAQLDALFSCPLPVPLPSGGGGGPLEGPLLALALTAHLQAGCRTVVCSVAPEPAMRLLHLLRPFGTARQQALHRLSVAAAHVPDLALQGLLLSPMSAPVSSSAFSFSVSSSASPSPPPPSPSPGSAAAPPIDDARLFQSLHPAAVVLLGETPGQTRVFGAAPAPEYAVLRREYVAGEIARLLAGVSGEPNASWAALRPLKRPAPWAADLALQLSRLPCSLRPAFAASRFRALQLRALALCRANSPGQLERAVLGQQALASGAGSSGAGSGNDGPVGHSPDFLVLLGVAEAMQPGTYVRLAGDPDVLESKFVELFESF